MCEGWTLKKTLIAACCGVALLLCAMGLVQYRFIAGLQYDIADSRMLYTTVSAHGVNAKSAMSHAYLNLKNSMLFDHASDWTACFQALDAAMDESAQIAELLSQDSRRASAQVIALAKNSLWNLKHLHEAAEKSMPLVVQLFSTRLRLYAFMTRPGAYTPHSLDVLLQAQSLGAEEQDVLRTISLEFYALRTAVFKSLLMRDSESPNWDPQQFRRLRQAVIELRDKHQGMFVAALEVLSQDLTQYAKLIAQYHAARQNVYAQQRKSEGLSVAVLNDVTALLEGINFLNGEVTRDLQKRIFVWQVLQLTLVAVVLMLILGVSVFLYRRLVQPLEQLHGYLQSTARGESPSLPLSSGTQEVDTVVRSVADTVLIHNALLIESRAESRNARETAAISRNDAAAKRAFMAHVSRELRTPLGGILGMSYLCAKTDLTLEQRDYMSKIAASAESLITIIDDTLDFLRLESDKLQLRVKPFSLGAMTDHLRDAHVEKALNRGLSLDIYYADELPEPLLGDAVRLVQILSNLVDNAIKYTYSGGIEVDISRVEGTGQQDATTDGSALVLHFAVRDTGIGLNPDLVKQLNLPVDAEDAMDNPRKFGGSGLGLTICRRLLALMDGAFRVDSVLNEGTTFHIFVPVERAPADMPADDTFEEEALYPLTELDEVADESADGFGEDAQPDVFASESAFLANFTDEPDLSGYAVLLAEGGEFNRQIGKELLTNCGLDVTIAETGVQAVELVQERPFDVVFMDLQIPGLDGLEATRRIRSLNVAWADMPIIATTAHVLPSDKERSREAGMQDHLVKPVDPGTLHRTLIAWLGTPVRLQEEYPRGGNNHGST